MNTSIIVSSLKYLQEFKTTISLSIWIYEELKIINYSNDKFLRSMKKWDYEISRSLINQVQDRSIFKDFVYQNHSGHVHKLIELLVSFDINKDQLLINSSKDGNTEMIRLLLAAEADVHANYDEALINSVENGHIEVVSLLLGSGANVHTNDEEALDCASWFGHTETVLLLLDHGADVHVSRGRALRYAKSNNHKEIIDILTTHMKVN